MTLYLDAFFLVNFLMDLLLLDLIRHFMRLVCSKKRLLAAAGIGSALACFLTSCFLVWSLRSFPEGLPWPAEAAKLLLEGPGVLAVMLLAAFGWAGPREMAWRMGAGYLAGTLLGGCVAAAGVHFPAGVCLENTSGYAQWKMAPLILWGVAAYTGIRLVSAAWAKEKKKQGFCCQVTLEYRGRRQTVTALCDTGNRLYEPYGCQPVHVVTKAVARKLCDRVDRVIYIPFQSVGASHGLLPGIRIDGMTVMRQGRASRYYDRPWIAVSPEPLSSQGRYEMLLHGEEFE